MRSPCCLILRAKPAAQWVDLGKRARPGIHEAASVGVAAVPQDRGVGGPPQDEGLDDTRQVS